MVRRIQGWVRPVGFACAALLLFVAAGADAASGNKSRATTPVPVSEAPKVSEIKRSDPVKEPEERVEPTPTSSPRSSEVVVELGRTDSVDIQMRRLGDQLAESVKSRAGSGRYDRWGLMPFTELGADVERNQLGQLAYGKLESALQTDHGFFCVDRAKLMEVVREKKLERVLIYEEAKIRQVGKAVGADVLVMGSVGVAGGRYVVNARAANVDTGQVVATVRVELDFVAFNNVAAASVMRTRQISMLKSAVLPGWGQWSNHQEVKGAIILVASATLLGFGLRNAVVGYQSHQSYMGITKDNPGDCTTSVQDRGKFNACLHGSYEKSVRSYQLANKFFIGLAAVYVFNVVDAFVFGPNAAANRLVAPQGRLFDLGVDPSGLTFSGRF